MHAQVCNELRGKQILVTIASELDAATRPETGEDLGVNSDRL
jgi:hypothetical protein